MVYDPNDKSFPARFVDFIVGRPLAALVLGLLVVMGLAPGGQHITEDFTYRVWFNDDDPLIVEFDEFERRFGNDENALVVVHSPSGIFDKDSAELLIELTEALYQTPESIRVDSLSNFNWVHAEEDELMIEPLLPDDLELTPELLAARKKAAQEHESIPGYLMSQDATAALIMVALKPALDEFTDYGEVTRGVREIVAGFEGRGDHELFITGGAPLSHAFEEAAFRDMGVLMPMVLVLTILFLLMTFRNISGIVLPLVVIGLSVVATMGLLGWMAFATKGGLLPGKPFTINNMTSIMPQCLLAICVADAVHILVSYFHARAKGQDKKGATRYSLRKNLQPTLLTSCSTAIGFFSFSTADVVPIGQFGIITGLGTLLAWVVTYFVIGPLLSMLPLKAPKAREGDLTQATDRSAAIARRLHAKKGPIMGAFAVAVLGLGYLGAALDVNSDPFKYFRPGDPLNIAQTFLEDKLGGGLTIEASLACGEPECMKEPEFLKKVEGFQDWLESQDYVTNSTSIVDILKSMNRSLNSDDPAEYKLPESRDAVAQQYLLYTLSLPQGMDLNNRVTLSNDAIRLTSMWKIHDSKTVLAEYTKVEEKAAELGLKPVITGKAQLWQSMNPAVVDTFVTSLTVALILMSLLMILVFRSLKLGALAMVPNGVPLLLGAGAIKLLGRDLDISTVIIFSVCLGIAVDDTVHFLSNYNRLRREGRGPSRAVAEVFTHTMPALVATTAILVAAFGVFAFGTFVPNMWFGILVATILSVALFTDVTLLPALLLSREEKSGKG